MPDPHIRIATRKITPTTMPGSMSELDAMTDLCEKFPGDEWCLLATHFVGLEPGPAIDVLFIFVKAEFYPPARAEYYLDQIVQQLGGLEELELEAELIIEDGEEVEEAQELEE